MAGRTKKNAAAGADARTAPVSVSMLLVYGAIGQLCGLLQVVIMLCCLQLLAPQGLCGLDPGLSDARRGSSLLDFGALDAMRADSYLAWSPRMPLCHCEPRG